MKAVLCRVTIPRFLLGQTLGRVWDYFLFGPGGFLGWEEMEKPALRTPRYVRVKTTLTGICGSDVGIFKGQQHFSLEPYITFPAVLGHEGVGVVDEVGAKVEKFRPGDRVALSPYVSCLERGIDPPCGPCGEGRPTRCEKMFEGGLAPGLVGFNRDLGGTWAEVFAAQDSLLEPIPEGVSDEEIGAGAIGLCLIAGLRAMGYDARALAQSRYQFQSDMATKLGADEILPDGKGSLLRVAELTGARILKPMVGPPVIDGGVDVVYDCVGSSASLDSAIRAARAGGRIVLIGALGIVKGADLAPLWFREIELYGVCGGGMEEIGGERISTIKLALKLIAEKKLDLRPLLTHEFPLDQYPKALRVAMDHSRNQSIKVTLRPNP